MTEERQTGPSPSRETLRQLMQSRGGVARGETERTAIELPEGASIPRGSMMFPPSVPALPLTVTQVRCTTNVQEESLHEHSSRSGTHADA